MARVYTRIGPPIQVLLPDPLGVILTRAAAAVPVTKETKGVNRSQLMRKYIIAGAMADPLIRPALEKLAKDKTLTKEQRDYAAQLLAHAAPTEV